MNKSIAKNIDQLLADSGLFPTLKTKPKDRINFDFSEEVILVTGAAGSIGSELSKQLVASKFKKLILVDVAESPLYDLIKALEFEDITNVTFILLNITDIDAVTRLFEDYKPTLIFHTAAYKHVPLMEQNAYESVKLNILGTKLLADLSITHKANKFVFISTDKAVNPISVMGISKRIAEKYLDTLNHKKTTVFVTARFGNIAGSNGSIIPLLKNQIESKKTITITDRSIARYFIGKTKACNLILNIAKSNQDLSNMLTFNMGDPIKVVHIIERILVMHNKTIEDVDIKIIGLRPGEKFDEEISTQDEMLVATKIDDVFAVKQTNQEALDLIAFDKLKNITPYISNIEIKSILISLL